MKYIHRKEVRVDIAEKSKRDIESINAYVDGLHGTIISIQRIRSGQPRPYADSVDEALIFCHQPNAYTTNGPALRTITYDEAAILARIFVGSWADEPKFLESRLVSLKPEPNPCGMEEKLGKTPIRSSCWRVIINHPYCD